MASHWFRSTTHSMSCGIAATALVVASGVAAAATSLTYSGYSVMGDQTLNVLFPSTESGQAGEFQLVTGSGVIDAWCIDLFNYLSSSGTYDVASFSGSLPGVPALTTRQIGEIGALVRNGDSLVASPPTGYSANDVGAAIQIAIWSLEYPGFSYTWSPAHPIADALATTYLGDATTGVWAPYFGVRALVETTATDQTLVAGIPEPSTWAMASIGFAALAWTAWGRRGRRPMHTKGEAR